MRFYCLAFAAIYLLTSIILPARICWSQDDTIRIKTDLVTIPLTVFDRDGRQISGLLKDNFRVFEDGVEQDIALFETTNTQITVFLLLDRSGSIGAFAAEMAEAASIFVKQMRPGDFLLAASFANEVDVLVPKTRIADVRNGIKIRGIRGDNNTMLFDAMDFALKKMKKVKGRKAIVLFSDGAGTPLYASAKSNLSDAEEQESLIYTIQYNSFMPTAPKANRKFAEQLVADANKYMRDLPEKTGGRYFAIDQISDLGKTFEAIVNELSQQYSLGYYPLRDRKDGERCKIAVRVNVPGLSVRSRNEVVYSK